MAAFKLLLRATVFKILRGESVAGAGAMVCTWKRFGTGGGLAGAGHSEGRAAGVHDESCLAPSVAGVVL